MTAKTQFSSLVGVVTTLCISCAPLLATKGTNFLVIVSDDQRPDTIAAHGNPRIQTPHLDQLARNGLTFTKAVCANPICVASRAELLTGTSGFTNGVMAMPGQKSNPATLPSWARTFSDAGYRTGYIGKWHTSGRPLDWGFKKTIGLYGNGGGRSPETKVDWKGSEITGYRGWIFQSNDGKEKYPARGIGLTPRTSEYIADDAIKFISQKSTQPFFVHVNFTAPHDPLLTPPAWKDAYNPEAMEIPPNFLPEHPFDHGNFNGRDENLLPWPRTAPMVQDLLRMYYTVISDMDAQIGRILDALDKSGKSQDTIVIFTSDHGIAVGSHGLRGKQNMYEHTINVPLIVSGPGIKGDGRQTNAQVYLRDLFPTTCDVAGLTVPPGVEGISFAAVLKGTQDKAHDHIFGYFRDSQRMIRNERFKLIYYPLLDQYQFFDLITDPYETTNLATSQGATHREAFSQLKNKLTAWREDHPMPKIPAR
ncbi:MAG: sulfatase-like hydrolase/transferase [Verrucomicrobiota bacterium]